MRCIPLLVLGCVAAAVAQLPPRLEVPGAQPAPVQHRATAFRRPASRAFVRQDNDDDDDDRRQQPIPPAPRPLVRVRRPTHRGRQQRVGSAQIASPAPPPKQDFVSLTPRPVSEDPDDEFNEPAPPQPTRASGPVGRTLTNRPQYLQPAVFRNGRPLPAGPGAPAPLQQGGFRPLVGNDDEENVIIARPASPTPNPRAYLPGTGPNAPSGGARVRVIGGPLLELPLAPEQRQRQQEERPQQEPKPSAFRPPLTAIPAAQLQLAQQLAQQQQQAAQQVQLSSVAPPLAPQPTPGQDDDEGEEDNDAVANPNRRQSLSSLSLQGFKSTPGNYLVTPSSLELDDDVPQSGFTPSVPRRPQSQPQVFRPSPVLDLDNNAFSPAPRPLPPQPQPIQRRPLGPSPLPASPSPSSQPTSSPRRPVIFRPERVSQVTASPAPNLHVHQILREDDDYEPIARQPQRPVRPQPSPQPRPAAPALAPRPRPQGASKREKKPVAQVLRRYREDNPDGSITWGYENDDGSFKEETIGVDCMVRGKYGYVDPDGNRREYTYQSGIPCTPAPPGQEQQNDDQEGGYVDYQNNQFVLPNGQAIDLDAMVKNRKRKPTGKSRNN